MVLIDGKPEYSCSREVATVAGKAVTTVEGLVGNGDELHPLQQAFLDEQAGQCGYCLSGHPDLGDGAARRRTRSRAAPTSSRRSIRISAAAASTTASSARCRRPAPRSRERGHDLQHAAAEPDRQSDPVAMDRVRGERPRARRLRQGRDRPGHPHRAHPDRRRRARRAAGADQSRLRPDRREPGRGLHLGQLFDRGRRRLDPAGLRRGALAVPRSRSPRRCAARSGELSIEDGKFLRSGKDTGRDYWSMAGEIRLERRASGTAPVKRPSTYKIVGKHLPRLDLPAKVAGAGFIHDIAPRTCCTPACCASPGAARISRRSTRAPCARPPGRRSRSSAKANSSPSPPTAKSR